MSVVERKLYALLLERLEKFNGITSLRIINKGKILYKEESVLLKLSAKCLFIKVFIQCDFDVIVN